MQGLGSRLATLNAQAALLYCLGSWIWWAATFYAGLVGGLVRIKSNKTASHCQGRLSDSPGTWHTEQPTKRRQRAAERAEKYCELSTTDPGAAAAFC